MNQRPIVIDGKTYNSVNEMPPDVRTRYEQAVSTVSDENRGGAPAVFGASSSSQVISNMMKFIVDGREYNRIEDLPPEARAKYEQAMGTLDKNQNGMPDFLEGMMNMTAQSSAPQQNTPVTTPRPITRMAESASPSISPDTSNGWMLALAGGVILFLCAIGAFGVWFFFLR